MYFSGITLNIISLSGLALGVGMLVDNSIVVIENIYRMRSEGKSMREVSFSLSDTSPVEYPVCFCIVKRIPGLPFIFV